jgi:hypothetical protein
MNERIKLLAEQAGGYVSLSYDHDGKLILSGEDNVQKFAELIVLECEKVVKNPKWYSESPSDSWGRPIRHVCNVMKEHFGVEE